MNTINIIKNIEIIEDSLSYFRLIQYRKLEIQGIKMLYQFFN
jgi:hypothetical protein